MLVFMDCEAYGGSPVTGRLTEFGAVVHTDFETPVSGLPAYHGVLILSEPDPAHPAIPRPVDVSDASYEVIEARVFRDFREWLTRRAGYGHHTFVSDNVAFDWQWINCGFWRGIGMNPMGHSGRRISDFYAGLVGDWGSTQPWKRMRVTPHDHNPVHDAMGNVEAFRRMMEGERA